MQGDAIHLDTLMLLVNALQREPMGSAGWLELRARIDSLLPATARIRMSMPKQAVRRGWIGINAGGVPMQEKFTTEGDVVRYMLYPDVISVDPDSPAFRAGIVPGDVLVAYNGVDVVEHEVNLTQILVPEKRMLITIRRDGENRDFTVPVAKAPEHVFQRRLSFDGLLPSKIATGEVRVDGDRPEAPRIMILPGVDGGMGGGRASIGGPAHFWVFAPDGIFGARVSLVSADLARALKLEPGVLVNDVPDDTPAAKSGLHAGDVIVGASGQPITTLSELQRITSAQFAAHAVDLQIIRDKKSRKVTVRW
jgi:serine protease Do